MKTNHLSTENSPYLLQHVHNPVDWYPWGDEALEKARKEDKMLLISIGYSSCHWCHVMEKECFEDEEVAAVMNRYFVNIKVDREERPDIDQVYMSAVQLMQGNGGWPLNCVALPDGRPFFGGTYFPKERWLSVLSQLADVYAKERSRVEEYAEKLAKGINEVDLIHIKDSTQLNRNIIDGSVSKWMENIDSLWGGPNRAPKFPLPNNYEFLMQYAHTTDDTKLLDHVSLTLEMMASRGLYDQIGGGFARYSTDPVWKVPHFEKMLYDNAQLISLYSNAYKKFKNEYFRHVVFQSLEFIEREMTGEKGNFYSALDADSEGEEGKFYIWSLIELQQTLGKEMEAAKRYFYLDEEGLWENGNYILMLRPGSIASVGSAEFTGLTKKLLKERGKRPRPGLDSKSLTSWNALMCKAYIDAYKSFGEQDHLDRALGSAEFIDTNMSKSDNGLFHIWNDGESKINGYLEDYTFVIDAYISLYEVTYDKKWIMKAHDLTTYVDSHFATDKSSMYFFNSSDDKALIARKMETQDNVIPSSNSVMAKNLFRLGVLFEEVKWMNRSRRMFHDISENIPSYGSAYSNWMVLGMWELFGFNELVICGLNSKEGLSGFFKVYHPSTLLAITSKDEYLPVFNSRVVSGETYYYVCEGGSCQLPVKSLISALERLP